MSDSFENFLVPKHNIKTHVDIGAVIRNVPAYSNPGSSSAKKRYNTTYGHVILFVLCVLSYFAYVTPNK